MGSNDMASCRVWEYVASGEITITDDCPIHPDCLADEIYIRGIGSGTVIILAAGAMQPCIGYPTRTGLSYGRFELSDNQLKKITIDNARVVCLAHKSNPFFTLGTYGKREVPEVCLINGASIECPEATGTRYMANNIKRYDGSTKLTGSADYFLVPDGGILDDCYSEEQRKYVDEIRNITRAYDDKLNPTYSVDGLRNLLEITRLVIVSDPEKWNGDVNSPTYYMTLRTCALLGISTDLASSIEWEFELRKLSNFVFVPFNKEVELDCVNCAIIVMRHLLATNKSELLGYERAYEAIPTYCWTFTCSKDHRQEVINFLNQKTKQEVLDSDEFKNLVDDEVRSSFLSYEY